MGIDWKIIRRRAMLIAFAYSILLFGVGMANIDWGQNMRVLNAELDQNYTDVGSNVITGEIVTFTPESAYITGRNQCYLSVIILFILFVIAYTKKDEGNEGIERNESGHSSNSINSKHSGEKK